MKPSQGNVCLLLFGFLEPETLEEGRLDFSRFPVVDNRHEHVLNSTHLSFCGGELHATSRLLYINDGKYEVVPSTNVEFAI